jgi:hypothetical protein
MTPAHASNRSFTLTSIEKQDTELVERLAASLRVGEAASDFVPFVSVGNSKKCSTAGNAGNAGVARNWY